MATWKKVLIAGADLTSTSDFTNNTGDLVSTTTASAIKVTNGSNTMLGNNTQVSVELDINGLNTALTSSTATTSDLLVIADADDSNKIKKITLGNAVGAVSTGVSTVQLTADGSSNTGNADNGAVVFNIAGGTGVTTAGTDGTVTVNANTATTSAVGVAKFNSANFAVDAGDVTIKGGGVDTAQLAASAVETAKINNQAVTDAKIANAGITSAGKVSLTALRFHNFGTHETTAGNLHASDRIILNDASDQLGSGDHNYTSTLGTLDGFIANNSASLSNVHSTLDLNSGSGQTLNGGGLTYVSDITADVHGHITSMSTATIPNADGSTAGVVTAGAQTIGGVKTFSSNASFSGNLTVAGDLVVNGSSTTLQTATLNVEDKDIVGAVPSVAHATDNSAGYTAAQAAAEGGGFFLASHHGSDTAAFAGLSWSASGNLTGWSLNDTAVPDAGAAELYDSSGDANSAKYAVSVMSFGSVADTAPTGNQMGVGGFHFNTADKKLYVRID